MKSLYRMDWNASEGVSSSGADTLAHNDTAGRNPKPANTNFGICVTDFKAASLCLIVPPRGCSPRPAPLTGTHTQEEVRLGERKEGSRGEERREEKQRRGEKQRREEKRREAGERREEKRSEERREAEKRRDSGKQRREQLIYRV